MARKLMLAILILGLAGTCVLAADDKGVFVGAGFGYLKQDLSISTENFQDNSTAWKAFGGYRPMKFFSIEGGYIDFGSAKDSVDLGGGPESVSIDTTGWNLDLVGTIPLGDIIEIYGKAGYLWWDSTLNASSASGSTSGSDWIYGAGAKFVIAKKAAIRLEYEKFDLPDTKTLYLISTGLEWRF